MMDNLPITYCERCKVPIVFIRTVNGKMMPCDVNPVMYREDPYGTTKLMTRSGKLVFGSTNCTAEDYTGLGYYPHFSNCMPSAGRRQISSEGQKRLDGYKEQAKRKASPPPTTLPPKTAEKPAAEESKFEQLCLFGNNDRRNRHPM